MRDGMVALDGGAARGVDAQFDSRARFGGILVGQEMEQGVAGFLSIDNVPDFSAGLNFARVAHLPAHFGVKRGGVKCDGDFVL